MQNLSDNELDKHFQEAAEKYRPSFDPEAWQRMQERMDKPGHDGVSGFARFRKGLPFLLIFLAGSLTGILTWSYLGSDEGNPDISVASLAEPGTPAPVGDTQSRTQDSDKQGHQMALDSKTALVPRNSEENITTSGDKIASGTTSGTAGSSVPSKSPVSTQQHEAGISTQGEIKTRNRQKNERDPHARSEEAEVQETAPDQPRTATVIHETEDDSPERASFHFNNDGVERGYENPSQQPQVTDSTSTSTSTEDETPDRKEETVAAAENEDAKKRPPGSARLSLIAAISPDFSSVNFGQQTKPGINYGILAEYHLTPRLSLMSGVISATKLYKARDIEYYGRAIPEAEGDCRIIDIPLNVYYRFANASRFSWFASAGLSSYIMTQENYVFYYYSSYGKSSYSREVRNENNEWFKVLNVSAGVSKKIGPRFSIEIEPFVKVPLTGVGEGELDVSTIGLFLRARYEFLMTQ